MLKNKKKLRRQERRNAVVRTAQTLVLTGALLVGGVVGAQAAATDINQTGTGAVSINKDTTVTGTTYFQALNGGSVPAFETTQASDNYTTLTITGNTNSTSLTALHKLTFTDITLSGAAGGSGNANKGALYIGAGGAAAKLFTGGATTINGYGLLQVGTDAPAANTAGTAGTAKLASLSIAENGSLVLGGAGIANGTANNGGEGTLVVDGAMTTAVALQIGGAGGAGTGGAGSTGGAGNLTVNGNFTSSLASAQTIGGTGGNGVNNGGGAGGAGGVGMLTLKGATSSFADALNIGGASGTDDSNAGGIGGAGTLNLAGGTTTFNGAVQIGATKTAAGTSGAAGTLNISGGATADFKENVTVGTASSDASALNIGGAALGATAGTDGTATLLAAKTLTFGGTSTGTIGLGGAGSVGAVGGAGTLDVSGTLTGTNGTLVIGGTGATGSAANAGNAGGIGTINIKNGGTATFVVGQVIGGTGGNNSGTAGGNGGAGGAGVLNIEANAGTVVFGTLTVGGAGGTSGSANGGNGGAGTVNVSKAAQSFAGTVTLGGAPSGTVPSANGGQGGLGTLNVNSGSVTALADATTGVQIGSTSAWGGSGMLHVMNGGAVTSAGDIKLGAGTADSGAGTLQIDDGGRVVVATGKAVTIGGAGATKDSKVSTQAYKVGNSGTDAGLTSGTVTIAEKGTLEVRGNLSLTSANLAATGQAVNLAANGLLDVQGKLTLTDTNDVSSTWAGTARAQVFEVSNASAHDKSFTLNSTGTLTLLGDGTNYIQASEVVLNGGATLNLGVAAGTGVPETKGGSYTGMLTTTSGNVNVAAGTWNWNTNSNALTLGGNGTLTVSGGTLNLNLGADKQLTVGKTAGLVVSGGTLDLTGSKGLVATGASTFNVSKGSLVVATFDGTGASAVSTIGGSNTATMTVTSADANAFKTVANNLKINNLGALHVQQGAVFNAGLKTINTTNVKALDVQAGGTLFVDGSAITAMTLAEMKAARNDLAGAATPGLVNFGGVQISDITGGKVAYSDVAGLSSTQLIGTTVTGASGTLTTMHGAFKNIEFTGSPTGDQAVGVTGTLQLAGDTPASQLVGGVASGSKANVTVNTGSVLMLGTTGGSANGGGTISGNTILNDSAGTALNVVSGQFAIGGNLVASAAGNNSKVNVDTGKLTVSGSTGAGNNTSDVAISNGGSLVGTGAVAVNNVTLTGGSLISSADKTTAANGNLTTGTVTTAGTANVLTAGNDLTVAGFSQTIDGVTTAGKVSNATITAGNNMTVTANGVNAKNTSITAGNILTVTAGNIVADGLTISAKSVAADNSNSSVTAGAGGLSLTATDGGINLGTGNVTVNAASKGATITATKGTLTTGGITTAADGAAAINVKTLTVGNGGSVNLDKGSSLVTTGTGADKSNIAGTLTLNGATATVGDLEVTGATTLSSGASLTTSGTLTASDNITVGSNVANSTGKLSVKTLNLGGKDLFADPAWVAGQTTHETGYASQVAVGQFSTTAGSEGKLTGNVVGGQASQITLGSTDVAWVQKKLDIWNSEHRTNIWGQGNGLVSAALGIVRPIDVNGQTLVVDGARTAVGTLPAAGTASFASNSLLIVDANSVGAANTALTAATVTVQGDAKLMMTNANVGTTYKVATAGAGGLTVTAGSWTAGNMLTDHRLLAGALNVDATNTNATVTITQRPAASVLPRLSAQMGGLLDQMVRQNLTSENSPNAGVRFANRAINRLEGDAAAKTIEGAAQLAAVGGTPGVTMGAATAATNAATSRTSFAQPRMDQTRAVAMHQDAEGNLSLDTGLSAGEGMKNGVGLWIMPLYQSNNVWGMETGSFKSGYNSDLAGVALGADVTFNDMFRVGAAFNLGGGYAQSNGDFYSTENRFNFWGVNLYGGWTQNNFGVTADVGYTSTYNMLKQNTPAVLELGEMKSDVNASAWSTGLRGEYKWDAGMMDIIPHVGVRYTGLNTQAYDVRNGGTVFSVEESFQSIWTFPVGVTFSKGIESGSGWQFKPQLDLGIIPAAGDVKTKSNVRIPNVNSSAEMKMQVVDYLTFDGGLGFDMKKDNVSFGINYNIQASEHRTAHGVFGTFRYEF